MTTRRRFLWALLASGGAAALSACGGGGAAPPPAPTTSPPAAAAAPTTAPAASAPTVAPAAAPTTAPAAVPTVAAQAAAAPTTAAPAGGSIYFGVSGPFSGDNAEYGRIWKKAMAMALDEVNGAGGVKGRKVELLYEDTQADPKQSVPVAQKFVNDSRVLAELGDFASPASMAASPIYQRAKMVQFGFTNSHPDFTKGGEFMFSLVLTQLQDASFLAQTGVDRLGKKQAVLYRDTDWGKITNQIYVDKVKQLGGDVVSNEKFLETEKEFSSILAKVRDAKPDVLALIAYYNDGALIAQQAKTAGLQVKTIANGACYSPQFIKLGGDAVNDTLMTTVFFPGNPRPEVKKFVDAYQQRNNELPDQFAALSYDAVKIISWATDKAGFDRIAIQKVMAESKDIPSVIFGPFQFGADRRVNDAKAVVIQVKNGAFVAAT